MLTLGVRALCLHAPDGWDKLYPLANNERWDFEDPLVQEEAKAAISYIDPVVVHAAPPCTYLSIIGPHPSSVSYSAVSVAAATKMVEFALRIIESRVLAGGGGYLESPGRSRCWKMDAVTSFFGLYEEPLPRKYFVKADLCAYGMVEPSDVKGSSAKRKLRYRKQIIVAATYPEMEQVEASCPGDHDHQRV